MLCRRCFFPFTKEHNKVAVLVIYLLGKGGPSLPPIYGKQTPKDMMNITKFGKERRTYLFLIPISFKYYYTWLENTIIYFLCFQMDVFCLG